MIDVNPNQCRDLPTMARYYAEKRGWHIFPLQPGSPLPLTAHGYKDATCNVDQVVAWWKQYPTANIGINLAASGLMAADVDPRNGGDVQFKHLYAGLDSPLKARSAGMGLHLFFKVPEGVRVKYKLAEGIEGKWNGYVVLAPSVRRNFPGKPDGDYLWAGQGNEWPADMPESLADVRKERPSIPFAGDPADLEKIKEALSKLDYNDHDTWYQTMASVKHWQDNCPGAGTSGYEAVREWSAQYAHFKSSEFDHRWESFDSSKPGARTLGSLLHDAGLTAQQTMIDAAAAFASLPVEQQQLAWVTEPVKGFGGATEPSTVLAEMLANEEHEFGNRWRAGNLPGVVRDLAWRCGSSCELVLQVLKLHEGFPGDSAELRGAIAHACADLTSWYTVGKLTDDQRRIELLGMDVDISVDDGALVSAFHKCLKALPLLGTVFQRGGELVWVDPTGRIGPYNHHSLAQELETYLRFGKGKKNTPAKCPSDLTGRLLGYRDFQGLGELSAAVPLPVVRADGTVIVARGLDDATGLYLLADSKRQPSVLDRAGIRAAFARVWAPFREFPFADDASRGVFVSALLTAVCRPALTTSPAFLINAQKFGSGKTLLSQCLMELACAGRTPTVLPTDDAEQAKTLASLFRSGPRGLLFDNVFGMLHGSGTMCMALTSASYSTRVLGSSEIITLENRALCVLNGNNVGLQGDVVRRILQVVLDSAEGVELQQHDFDPLEVVTRDRESLRADLIDLLVTYRAEGMQEPGGGLASFEAWNALVRGCTQWLRDKVDVPMADPLDALRAAQIEDPQVIRHRYFQSAWLKRFGHEPVLLRELSHGVFDAAIHPDWAAAYEEICTDRGGRINPTRLAYWLRDNKRKKVDGFYFDGTLTATNAMSWCLKKV